MADADLIVRLVGNTDKLERSLNRTDRMLNKFSSSMTAIGTSIAGAFAAESVIQFGKEAVLLAAKAEGVRAAFQNLDSPNLLNNLQRATRGTVADLQLMQSAVQAKNFKIPIQQLGTYFEFATTRALQTGQSVDYLVESIITGIGRKSPLILDNLGISAAQLSEELKKTGDFGEAAGNIIQRSLEETGEVMDTTATKIGKLQASFLNFKERAGGALINLGTLIIDNLDKLPPEIRLQIAVLNGLIDILNDTEEAAKGATGPFQWKIAPPPITPEHVETLQDLKNQLKELEQQKLTSPISGIAALNVQIQTLKTRIEELDKMGILSEVEKKLLAISKIPAQMAMGGISFDGLMPPKSELQQTIDLFNKQKEALEGMANAYKIVGVEVKKTTMSTAEFTARTGDAMVSAEQMTALIQEGVRAAISGFAQDLGRAAMGVGNFGENVLAAVAGFMRSFGEALIASGVAGLAAKSLIANPALAIAAGATLVALSSALQASAQKSLSSMSGGGGGSVGASRSTGIQTSISREEQQVNVGGTFKVQGSDLILVLEKANYRKSQTGG